MWELISHNDQPVSVYAIDNAYLASFSRQQFEAFIIDLINKKKEQMLQNYNSSPATFYMWVDDMASQLRFNILSGYDAKLPFGCQVEVVNSIEPIWQEFKQLKEISWSELEFFEDEDDMDEGEEEYILKVYMQRI